MSDFSPSFPWLSLTAGVAGIAAAVWQERGIGSRAQNPYYVAPVDSGFSADTHDHLSKTLGRDGRLYELRQERFRDQRSSRGGEGHPHDVMGIGTLDQIAGYEEHVYGAAAAVDAYREARGSASMSDGFAAWVKRAARAATPPFSFTRAMAKPKLVAALRVAYEDGASMERAIRILTEHTRGAGSAARKPKRQALTPTRLADLEKLKYRLRGVVFEQDEGSERGEKARGLLKKTRERIIAHEAPARAVAARAAKAERKALAEYLEAALAPSSRPQRGHSMEAHRAVEDLSGGRERAFALKRLWERVQETGIRSTLEIGDDAAYDARMKKRFARTAREDGFGPGAVRAFLAVQ